MDFVLKDPREKEDDKREVLPPHREELAVVPKPWNRSYLSALDVAIDVLHVTNPCMLQVLELWHTSFGLVYSLKSLKGSALGFFLHFKAFKAFLELLLSLSVNSKH